MADNITVTAGTLATDEIDGTHYPRSKLAWGASGAAVDASASNPLPVTSGFLPTGTNRSGTITEGGSAQQLAAANASRKALDGQNISAGDLWINEFGGTAAVGASGSYKVPSGYSFSIGTSQAISIIGATSGQAFTATEV